MSSTPLPPYRAIVIGASLAGLLAARVLSEYYQEVVLLERDELDEQTGPRKGTPHAGHAHGLLARGVQGLEQLFPGLCQTLMAQGVISADVSVGVPFRSGFTRLATSPVGVNGLAVSRYALETALRRRVLALPGVRLRCGVTVSALLHDDKARRVTGVSLLKAGCSERDSDEDHQILHGALVVDASGRGSRLPSWLRRLGYRAPEQEEVEVDVAYSTAYFRRDPGQLGQQAGALVSATPTLPRSGVVLAQEPDAQGTPRWVVTLAGYDRDHPTPTLDGMRQRACEMRCDEMIRITHEAEPITPVTSYRFTRSQWRHYERLRDFPAGLLAMGDAIASFNPTYGQGMTVAICEAQALSDALALGDERLAPRFFQAAARIVGIPWQIAVGADLALPCVPGHRPLPVRIVNAYMAGLFRAAEHDAEVGNAFVQVAHMLREPATLFAPRILWRVLFRRAPHPVDTEVLLDEAEAS